MNEVGLEFVAVSKWYGQVSALTDVSLGVGPGVTGLVGQNGAGKSTLLKLASGLLRPSQGEVRLCGRAPTRSAARARLGLCPDLDRFYERLTGLLFVTWMLRLQGLPGRRARERAAETLARFGLAEAMHRRIGGYSKGMRQRVKLAQALAHEPEVVLLDEPLTGLDPVARHEIGALILGLGEAGIAVLVSSHVLHELQNVASRFLLVHRGRLLAEGGLEELREQLDDRPRKLALRSPRPRQLAARICDLPQTVGVRILEDAVHVESRGGTTLYEHLTRIGAEDGLLEEVVPLDDDLEAVFEYLVS